MRDVELPKIAQMDETVDAAMEVKEPPAVALVEQPSPSVQ
jgi:hypothetical protein